MRGGLVITAEGPSFLYHQVRLLVATLRAVRLGDIHIHIGYGLITQWTPLDMVIFTIRKAR